MRAAWNDALRGPTRLQVIFERAFPDDPATQVLLNLDHQLATDADLDEVSNPRAYARLLWQVRDAMARKLGYEGYEPRPE